MSSERYVPRKRTARDRVVWWVAYDLEKDEYANIGWRYKTKRECQAAINFYVKYPKWRYV